MPNQNSPWPPFPAGLLQRLRATQEGPATVHLLLWNGERLRLQRVVEETEEGLLAETDRGPEEQAAVVAIPWQSIAAAEIRADPTHRVRPGFRPA